MAKPYRCQWKRIISLLLMLTIMLTVMVDTHVEAAGDLKSKTGAQKSGSSEQVCDGQTHNYAEPVWQWNADNSYATVLLACVDCDHSAVKAAKVELPQTTAPTCEREGATVYAAAVEFDGETYSTVKTIAIPKEAHVYTNDYCCNCGAADPDMVTGECAYLVEQELDNGSYVLTLGGVRAGRFLFASAEDGWSIRTQDGTYLAFSQTPPQTESEEAEPSEEMKTAEQNGTYLIYAEEPFVWTYADGYFTAAANEETESAEDAEENEDVDAAVYYLSWSENGLCVSAETEMANAVVCVEHYNEAHQYDKGVKTEPDCTEPGGLRFTCTTCGARHYEDKVAPLGHTFGEWSVTRGASCLTDGEMRRECEICGAVETEKIAAGHSYEVTWQWNADHTVCSAEIACSGCDKETEGHGAKVDAVVTYEEIAATYEAAGEQRHIATAEYNGNIFTDIVRVEIPREIYPDPVLGTPEIPALGKRIYGCKIDNEGMIIYLDAHKDGITAEELSAVLVVPMENDTDNTASLRVSETVNFKDADIIVNGAELTITAENRDAQTSVTYLVIILGDTNLNGRVESGDVVKMNRQYSSTEEFADVVCLAADTNCNGRVDSGDAVKNQVKYTSANPSDYVSALK